MPWVKIPSSVEGTISLEGQSFGAEFTNDKGERFFRIPVHFAPKLLATGLGFVIEPHPPIGAPTELTPEPLGEDAATDFKTEILSQQQQISGLRSELVAAQAAIRQMVGERDDWKRKFEVADEENGSLRERLLELESPDQTQAAVVEKKNSRRTSGE